jgi:hypothetical protein
MFRQLSLIRHFLITIMSICALGCATNKDIAAKLESQQPTHNKLDAVFAIDLPKNKEIEFELTDTSPIFQFESGKSYFSIFSIEPSKILELFIKPTGSLAFEPQKLAQIFCPQVTFLDSARNSIQTVDAVLVYDRHLGFSTSRRGGTAIFEVPPIAKFAVVHSVKDSANKSIPFYRPASGYVVGGTYVREAGGAASYTCGPLANAIIRTR